MSIISKFPGGGGTGIQGIIENYYVYAGSNVSAGDLVEYINGIASQTTETSVDTQLSSIEKTGSAISAIKLDDSRIFIAHSYGKNYHLYGMIVSINGDIITTGTDTELVTRTYAGTTISTELLSDGRIFIAHSRDGDENYHYLYGIIVTINGTAITHGADIALSYNTATGNSISTQLLPNGNIFIAHSLNTNSGGYYLYGMIVTINGDIITTGTDTKIVDVTYTSNVISTELLSSGNIFIAHSRGTGYDLYGIVVTVSETNVIVNGSDTVLSTIDYTGWDISTEILSNDNILVTHSSGRDSIGLDLNINGIIVVVNGTNITKGTDTVLKTATGYVSRSISSQLLQNGNVFIACPVFNNKTQYLLGMIAIINNTSIVVGTDVILITNIWDTVPVSTELLSDGRIFISHGYSNKYYLSAQIFWIDEENNVPTNQIKVQTYEQQVRPATSSKFDGVAKTSGVGGTSTAHNQQVSIYTKPKRQNYKLKFTASGDISSIENCVVTSSLGINGDYNTTQVSLSFTEGKNEIDIPEGSIVTVQNSLFVPSEFILNPSSSYYYRIPRNLPIKRIDATNYTYEFIMPSENVEWHCFKSSGGIS